MSSVRIFLAMCMCIWCVAVTAETQVLNKPVTCDTVDVVFKALAETFQETPQWQGRSEGTGIVLTVNPRTGAWTLVEYNNTTACVIGVGVNSSGKWGTPV